LWPLVADIPAGGTAIDAGHPIVTLLAEGDDSQQVLEMLRRRMAQQRRDLRS
jgi:predicted ATP-grasp superfamily ATP-dependent carboligase